MSQIATRFFRLNINAPTIFVDSPQDGSQHVNGIVTFEGRAEDDYRNNLDLDRVYIQIERSGSFLVQRYGKKPRHLGHMFGTMQVRIFNLAITPSQYGPPIRIFVVVL